MKNADKTDVTKLRDVRKIETERLIIKPISVDHLQEAFEALDHDVTKFMSFSSPKTVDEQLDFTIKSIDKINAGTDYIGYVFTKNGEFVGGCGLHRLDTKTPEFGIWLKKEAHGNKYGQEVVKGLKIWADDNLDYEYLLYPAFEVNIASRKVAESLGGKIFRHYVDKDDQGKDMKLVEYRIYS